MSGLSLVQRAAQGLRERGVALLALQAQGLFEEPALPQVVEHEIEEVDGLDPRARAPDGNVLQQRRDEAANLKLALGRVVEYVERHLVSETASGDELVRREAGQDSVQSIMESVGHGDAARQRRT